MFKVNIYIVLCGPFFGFRDFYITDIRTYYLVADGSKADCLCSDATGTIQNMCGLVKAIICKNSVQNDCLFGLSFIIRQLKDHNPLPHVISSKQVITFDLIVKLQLVHSH